MIKYILEKIEREQAGNSKSNICLDEIQDNYERERERILRSKAPAALCGAVVRAVKNDQKFIGLYATDYHVYSQEFLTAEQLEEANRASGNNAISSHVVNSNLVNSCIDYMYEKRDNYLNREDDFAKDEAVKEIYDKTIEELEDAYDKVINADKTLSNSMER